MMQNYFVLIDRTTRVAVLNGSLKTGKVPFTDQASQDTMNAARGLTVAAISVINQSLVDDLVETHIRPALH